MMKPPRIHHASRRHRCGVAVCLARATTQANPRVGVLWHAADAKAEEEYLGALTKAFHDLGYIEGQNIELDHRFPRRTNLSGFAPWPMTLPKSKVDVIVAVTGLGAREGQTSHQRIPIVLVADPDPVGNGLVESLGAPRRQRHRPLANGDDLSGKRLALFKEALPKLARVAILGDPRDPFSCE